VADVTVVIPARDAQETIGATLAALAAQRFAGSFEVIVVDSGSADRTAAIAQANAVVSAVLRNPGGEPAGSRNLGVRHGSGEVLAFTDADCEPAPGWLAAGLNALERADLVQGAVWPARRPGPFDRTVGVGHDHGLYDTANLFVTRSAFERAGGFTPVIGSVDDGRAPFGEDAWMAWRARRAGARAAFCADAIVHHAVFPRGPVGYITERLRYRHFPPLVARIPELRSQFLWRGLFLSAESARFDLLLAGLVTRRRAPALLAALPYAWSVLRAARSAPCSQRPLVAGARVVADAVGFGALVFGSAAARTPVL
jgi:glycosyltransferase involved in cell wall biosynthesis